MASIKNKVPVTQTGSNTKKKDVPEGNAEIQIKEEPDDMDEYLMSSNTVIQTPGKIPVSTTPSSTSSSSNQVRLVTPGKTAPAQVPSPAAATAPAVTPKPTVGILTRLQAQNLAAQAASKAVPSTIAAKTPVTGAKDIGSSLTPKQKAAPPASAANGKPNLDTPKSSTISTNPKRVLGPPPPPPPTPPPRSSLAVGGAKPGLTIPVSTDPKARPALKPDTLRVVVSSLAVGGAKPGLTIPVSTDPKARPALKPDDLRVNIPSKAPLTVAAQKDGASSQVKTGSVTLLTSPKVAVTASALPKTTLLPGNPKTPVGGAALQKQVKDAKVVVRTPTAATSSGTAGKQLPIEAVPVVTSSSECAAQDQPVPCQQTPQRVVAETDPVTAPCPDAVSRSGQNADDYAGSYESGSADVVHGVLTQPAEATRTNSSVSDQNCAEDVEITIKIEPPDDYPDSTTTATPARAAVKDIGNSSANQSVKQTVVYTPHQAAQIQTVHAGNAAEVTTCDHDTTVVSSGVCSTAASAGQAASAVAATASAVEKPASSVLASSETGSRSSVVSKPTSSPNIGSVVCSETEGDSSAASNMNQISASAAATTSSSAAVGIATVPVIEIDLSIVKTEPVAGDLAEEPVSSEGVPTAVSETSNAEPSSGQAVADALQSQNLPAAAELHVVTCSSVLDSDAEERVSLTTSEHVNLTTDARQVVVSLATVTTDTSLPDQGMRQVDSRACDDQNEDFLVESLAEKTSASNQMKDGTSKQDSGKTMTTGETVTNESNSCVEPNFANDKRVELIGSNDNTSNRPSANANNSPTRNSHNTCLAADDDDDDDDEASLLFAGFSGVRSQVPSGDLSMKNQVSGLPAQTSKPVEILLGELNQADDMFMSGLEATLMERIVVSAKTAHQTTPQKPSLAKNSEHKQCKQLVENSPAASGGPQLDKNIVKRVIRIAKQDKSKRLAEDKPENKLAAPPAKRSRLMAPGGGKENAGLTGMQSKFERKPLFSQRAVRKKILTPCASQRPSVERKHLRKHPIGKVSDDLWMETSSFLDEDLRSEPESSEPNYIFEPRKHKQRADLRAPEKGKPHLNSKSGKSYMNQTNRGRILRKEPNVHFRSTRHIRFPFLSQFVKRSADRCLWDWSSCQVEDISASQRQDLLSDLNSVYLGRQPRFLLKPMGHLNGLSLETQLESQLLDFHSVRIIFLEVARDWVRNKPLHLLMTGQLRTEPRTYMPPKRMSKTNTTFENCQKAFCRDICYILADICNLGESDDSLFALPDGVSQFTANRVFRKVKQYLRNYIERMLRTVVADRYPTNTARLFDEDDRRSFRAKVKSKRNLKESTLIQLPVVREKVVPVEEPESVFPGADSARRKDPVLDDSAVVHEKVLRGPSKRLSAELSLPVQNSLAAAFDMFSKEAENICQGSVVETRVVADGSVVNGEASTIVDSSRLYSPTRPTDIEELEIAVLDNVEAVEVVTAEAINKETALNDKTCNVISGEVTGKPLSNGKISLVEKVLSPKNVRIDDVDDGEIAIVIDHEESLSSSVVEDTSHRKKLRSSVARRTAEASQVPPSMKRKKRTKTSREKKTKRKKEKRKSETHLSSERDRGHKKKRLKYSEEDNRVESKRQEVALPEIVAASKPEPVRICEASPSDAVYCDSYTSVVEDVLNFVPRSNFEDDFDPLLPSSKHYRNPYRLSWPLIEYFADRNVDMLSRLIGVMPDVNTFRTRLLKPGNSFLWSLVLAVFDVKTVSETEEIGLPQNLKEVVDDQIDIGGIGEDGVKKSVKGNNPLMQAFRQVVEAKRRLSRETQKSKPVSSITKLSAELAALRAAPKSAKPLYKPSVNVTDNAQNAFKASDPNESRLQDTVERSAQLASEALFQLCNDMKMILNEQEEEDASDFPRIVLPTADSHLGGLSSLVLILYENYERLSKISEETGFSQAASEMDDCITIIDDDDDSLMNDRLDEMSVDVKFGLQAGDVNQRVDDVADLEKPNDAPEKPGQKLIILSDEQCPEIPFPKEVESAVDSTPLLAAEKEAEKVRDKAEVLLFSTAPAMTAASDRQYISSFPPIGVIKKKSKVTSQGGGVPRMVFSKLIGPALEERFGSTGSVTVPSPLEMPPQPPVSASHIASASLHFSSAVTSSPLPLVPEVSVGVVQAQDGCETNQPSAANIAGPSAIVGKNDSLPFSSNAPSSEVSSQNDAPANTKTLVKSKATQQKITILPSASDAAGTAQVPAIISALALSYATSAPSVSSAPVAVTVAASVSTAAAVQVAVPPASPDESSYSATFPPIPPEKPSSENSVVPPPLPLGEADMLPPPLPPMNLSEMATSGSNTLAPTSSTSSAYYSGYFSSLASSSQAQDFSASSSDYNAYAGGFVDPTQTWMYDQSMYPTSNQAPILDPSLMAYPPPLQSDPMSFYLQPTNQPPPYLPAAPAGQMFPAYPSGQSVAPSSLPYMQTTGQLPASFSFPPPNLPPAIPHPTIPPPAIPHPSIPPPSIPPPAIFPSAAPFPTSIPPPAVMPYNAYGSQWTPDVSSQSNQFLSSDYYSQAPGSTLVTTVTSSSASMSVPPPVLDGQQGSLLPEALSSIHDMVKHPPPVIPGSSIPDSHAQDTNPDHQADFSLEKDQSVQFSSKSNDDAFNYAAQSFKNKSQDAYPAVSSSSVSRFSGPEQSQEFEMNDNNSYMKPSGQKSNRAPGSSEVEKDFCSENQPWDSVNLPRDGVSGSWESANTSIEDSWPSQSGQLIVEQGAQGRQQRPTGPLLQKPREGSMNIQPRKPPLKDQEQMYDSHQRQSGHQEQSPGSQIRQHGPGDLDQRPGVNRHLQPTSDPRRSGPLPRQPGPHLRQPVPESRQPGSLLRQPVPEPRHPGPLIRPLLRQPGPKQKQSGQPLRQPGTAEQKQEVPQRRQGLQPRQQNSAGQEQKLIGSQSRPSGPQQRLNGPDQGHTGSLQGPRDPERRLLGPQVVGLQSGPRSVAPLMAVPVRRPLEGSANQSAKHERPVHATPRGPLSNTRFFVFNTDRSACEAAEHLLLCSGAQRFDPYNINALRVMPEIRCLLLVHKEDLKLVQRIPSLLRLKRDLRVSFVMFADASDIQQKRLVAFFPRAGTMIMDLTALLACKSDVLDGMCQFMTQQTVEKRTSWKLMLPSNVFNAIDFLKYKYEDEPEEHVRLAEVSQILATYKTSGIVEFLPDNPYRGQPRTTVEYQASCVALQISRLGSYRHFLFVSDMPRNHPDANLFLNNGIDILSIPEFMRCFVSRQVEHQPKLHPPYITRVTMNRYHDAAVSNGTECIAI